MVRGPGKRGSGPVLQLDTLVWTLRTGKENLEGKKKHPSRN